MKKNLFLFLLIVFVSCAKQPQLLEYSYDEITADISERSVEQDKIILYPCLPFSEDVTIDYYDFENVNYNSNIKLYTFDEIPQNFVALPIKYGEQILFADNPKYPLYKSKLLVFDNQNDKRLKKLKNSCKKIENPKVITVTAVGDIILCRGVDEVLLETNDVSAVFDDTLPLLKECDFTIGNLEGAVTEATTRWEKTFNFKFNKNILPYLSQAGFDYLMLTNNHCYDYCETGFIDTLNAVKECGFATSGVGLNKEQASQFYHTEIKGQKIAVLSIGAYPNERSGFSGKEHASATDKRAGILWNSPEIIEQIKEEKKLGNVVIINVHAGYEYSLKYSNEQKEMFSTMCDAGADLIFGSHPHVLQPIEMYNNSLIVYSLGNFVFPGMDDMPNATDTMVVRVGIVGDRMLYYKKYLATIQNTKVVLKK